MARARTYRSARERLPRAPETPPAVRTLAMLLLALAVPCCAGEAVSPLGRDAAGFRSSVDEQQLWEQTRRLERRIEQSGAIHEEPRLDAYLGGVAERLVGEHLSGTGLSARIRVLEEPYLNAFALPHGVVFVNTGLLARMENEAQLAALLGHELTHFTHRHSLRQMRKARAQRVWANVLGGLTAAVASTAGSAQAAAELGGLAANVYGLAAVTGYSRELEAEADAEGFRLAANANYDYREGQRLFEHLSEEQDEAGVKEPYFFGSHPRLAERIASWRSASTARDAEGPPAGRLRRGEADYLAAIRDVMLVNAELDLELGRVHLAAATVERYLERWPESARGHVLRAGVLRRGLDGGTTVAEVIAEYEAAALLDPSLPDPHRELGLVYRARGDRERASAAFARYLELQPEAVDRAIVEAYLAEPKGE